VAGLPRFLVRHLLCRARARRSRRRLHQVALIIRPSGNIVNRLE
jgi:hypothetical protein